MDKTMHRFFLAFIFLISFKTMAQEYAPPPPPVATAVVELDTAEVGTDSMLKNNATSDNIVFPKKFDEKFQDKYKGPEYDYTTIKPRESLWQKIQKRIKKILESIFGEVDPNKTSNYAENIMRVFAIIIIGFVLYFLIKFLLGKDGNFFFSKKNKKIIIADTELHENIHEINFPQTIDEFERKKDFRSAVRYRFLYVLKQLSDKKYIEWNPEKTNRDYFAEMKNVGLKDRFKDLIYIFDYVWYGEFDIDENSYSSFKQKFLNFKP